MKLHTNLQMTGKDDPVKWYYYPPTAPFYKKRLDLIILAIGNLRFNNLLEVGYGSGIFLPELSCHTNFLHGLDIHRFNEHLMSFYNNRVVLHEGSILDMPFTDKSFDAIVAVSILEHIIDLEKALSEVERTLTIDGHFYCGFPHKNIVLKSFFTLVGFDHQREHTSSPQMIMKELRKHFNISQLYDWNNLYVVCDCIKLKRNK